jgi:hypothetical protein
MQDLSNVRMVRRSLGIASFGQFTAVDFQILLNHSQIAPHLLPKKLMVGGFLAGLGSRLPSLLPLDAT